MESCNIKSKFSVCIVAYHNYDDILKALSTMHEYTPASLNISIYIVDNAANESDFSYKEFKAYLDHSPNIEYLDTGKNLGFGKGQNCVLKKLDSEYHCIMNPDILFCEDVFSKIFAYMNSNVDVGMVIPNIIDETGRRQMIYRKEVTVLDMFIRMFCKGLFPKRVAKHTLQNYDYSKPFQLPFGQGSFLVIRTELFKSIGGFDDRFFMYMEDADLCKRVNQISKFMYLPNVTVIHKWEKGSHKNPKLFKYHVQSMKLYFSKWGIKWM